MGRPIINLDALSTEFKLNRSKIYLSFFVDKPSPASMFGHAFCNVIFFCPTQKKLMSYEYDFRYGQNVIVYETPLDDFITKVKNEYQIDTSSNTFVRTYEISDNEFSILKDLTPRLLHINYSIWNKRHCGWLIKGIAVSLGINYLFPDGDIPAHLYENLRRANRYCQITLVPLPLRQQS